ncbi:CubicO group peptidase (beta-lactamase class C family) [Kribbella amoyensis]|uniref:CubicO group peptidase (Beta-lactamase class C family) n=2 Tax=Kribbella amoyensis TaxID=996641 RepID=A0A561B111_9ACTN|nr:CubicO group peptidase (beta-lactamase class C family) [Kribbella amoyensis]
MSVDALQEQVEADLTEFKVPGVSWAVIDGDEITATGQAGRAAADGDRLVDDRTIFQACSISKPITTFAMLRLVDRGLLDLDEDVNHRLTSWQIPPTGTWQPVVTLRQLVSHSAGLTVSGFPGYRHNDELPTTVQILDGVRPANTFGVRVDTVPGTQFRYSGGGTTVVQQLLEDVTGTPFRQLLRELVLEPLGMRDSDYAQPLPPDRHGQAATAHDEQGEPLDGRWNTYPELAAAGLWTTPTDLCRFALGVRAAYSGAGGALLSTGLAREMLTPQMPSTARIGGLDSLGLGLFLGGGGTTFGHSGGNAGFRCHLIAYRDTGQGAAVMTNGDNGVWVLQKAFASLATQYGWIGYPQELIELSEPSPEELDKLCGRYELRKTSLEIARDGSSLEVTFAGQEALTFFATGQNRFATSFADTQLVVRDGELYFVQNEEELPCRRL